MSNVLFENILLTSSFSQSNAIYEWENSFLIPASSTISNLSFDFFITYFTYFSSTVVTSMYVDNLIDNAYSITAGDLIFNTMQNNTVWY